MRAGNRVVMACSLALATCANAQPVTLGTSMAEPAEILTVYSTADFEVVSPILESFATRNPAIQITYHELQSQDLFSRLESEKTQTADFAWSSAMDLQMKLVNDGFAQPVALHSRDQLPDWAVWRDEAFAVSVEPAVIVYNKSLMTEAQAPQTRGALLNWLQSSDQAFGAIGTYDIERSGFGTLLAARDAEQSDDYWSLMAAMGQNQVSLFSSSSALIERVVDGRLNLAYNVIGSYAAARAQSEPQLGILFPRDYTLLVSRVAFVPSAARNPDLGKAFLTFLLSEDGQKILNAEVGFPAVHMNVSWTQALFPEAAAQTLALDPLPVDTSLLVYFDRARRDNLIRQWREALNGAL